MVEGYKLDADGVRQEKSEEQLLEAQEKVKKKVKNNPGKAVTAKDSRIRGKREHSCSQHRSQKLYPELESTDQ